VTIGGGVVLDPLAEKHRKGEDVKTRLERLESGKPEEVLEVLLAQAPSGTGMSEIIARTGWLESEVEAAAGELARAGKAERVGEGGLWLLDRNHFRAGSERILKARESFHRENPPEPGLGKEFLRARGFHDPAAAV